MIREVVGRGNAILPAAGNWGIIWKERDAMEKETLMIEDRICMLYRAGEPRIALLQPVDGRDGQSPERQAQYIRQNTDLPFLLCAFPVEDWDRELSPWPAPAVFGGAPFGGGALRTLAYVEERLLPALRDRYGADMKAVTGGYSLAGLFALWCGYVSPLFTAVTASSPSVWFDGWLEYAADRAPRAKAVYLSLGDREKKARNRRLARVEDCIRAQKRLLDASGVQNTLVWEPGNHFQNAAERTGRGFAWALERANDSL